MSQDPDVRQSREVTLLALIDAENRNDLDAVCAAFPHPRYELIGTHKVYDGTEQVGAYLRDRAAAFPDYRSELITYHHADEAVIAEVWISGTLLGAIARDHDAIAPTGRGFRCRMAAFFSFNGTRLDSARIYFDTATIARQLA